MRIIDFKGKMKKLFEMSSLEILSSYLGIQVNYIEGRLHSKGFCLENYL